MKTYELLGWMGAAVSCCFAIPQAVKLVRQSGGSAEGLSIWTWVLLEANALCWAIYAIGTQAYPAGAPSLVNAPCSALHHLEDAQEQAGCKTICGPLRIAHGQSDAPSDRLAAKGRRQGQGVRRSELITESPAESVTPAAEPTQSNA